MPELRPIVAITKNQTLQSAMPFATALEVTQEAQIKSWDLHFLAIKLSGNFFLLHFHLNHETLEDIDGNGLPGGAALFKGGGEPPAQASRSGGTKGSPPTGAPCFKKQALVHHRTSPSVSISASVRRLVFGALPNLKLHEVCHSEQNPCITKTR